MNKLKHIEKLILQILEEHQGRDNPITCQELESLTSSNSRKIRRIIAHLVIEHHIPIASSVHYPYGFYLITDKKEAEICLRQYYSRAREVVNRARILNKAVNEKFGISYQEEFEFVRESKPPT